MAYNEKLADHIREHLLIYQNDIVEKKMFGGVSFLYKGKMSIGVVGDDMAVRVVASNTMLDLWILRTEQ